MSFVSKGRPLNKKEFIFPFACFVASGFCFYQNYNKRQSDPNRIFWSEFEREQIARKEEGAKLESIYQEYVSNPKNEPFASFVKKSRDFLFVDRIVPLGGAVVGLGLGYSGILGFRQLRIGGNKIVGIVNSVVVVSVVTGYAIPLLWMKGQTHEQSREANAKFLEYVKSRFHEK